MAAAFEGDYVWEAKFKRQLPKAEQGDIEAQFDVGEMYEKGKGTDKDNVKAFGWYLKAAKQGDNKASYKIGLSYLKGTGVNKSPEKALMWLQSSAQSGYARAHFYIAEMHELGEGVEKNFDEALKYYQFAKDKGYAPADERIIRVMEEKKGAERKQDVNAAELRRRAEATTAAAARKRMAMVNRPVAQRVSQNTTTRPATHDLLLKGGWSKRSKPAEFLPSSVTKCSKKTVTIECVSKKLTRNIGMADIEYTTKAVIFSMKNTGNFKISYRNNVEKITVTDPEFLESGAKVPVQKGWQEAEHTLTCEIENERSLSCKKDKMREISFIR